MIYFPTGTAQDQHNAKTAPNNLPPRILDSNSYDKPLAIEPPEQPSTHASAHPHAPPREAEPGHGGPNARGTPFTESGGALSEIIVSRFVAAAWKRLVVVSIEFSTFFLFFLEYGWVGRHGSGGKAVRPASRYWTPADG